MSLPLSFLVLSVLLCFVTGSERYAILCPDSCASGRFPIDVIAAALVKISPPQSAVVLNSSSADAALSQLSSEKWSGVFISTAVAYWQTATNAAVSSTIVVVLDDPRSGFLLPTQPSGPNVILVPFPAEVVGYAAGVAACKSGGSSIAFYSDNFGSWARRMRASLLRAVTATCPSVSVTGAYGIALAGTTASLPSLADTMVTMGPTSTGLASGAAAASCRTVIPVQFNATFDVLTMPFGVHWATFLNLSVQSALGWSRELATIPPGADLLSTGTLLLLPCAVISTTPLINSAIAATRNATALTVETGIDLSLGLQSTIYEMPSESIGPFSLTAGGLMYTFATSPMQQSLVFDPICQTWDTVIGPPASIPPSAAFVPVPTAALPLEVLAQAFFQGGISADGQTITSQCGVVTVKEQGMAYTSIFDCSNCPSVADHSATYVAGVGVFLFGGRDITLTETNAAYWVNVSTMRCQPVTPPGDAIPMPRVRHGSTFWNFPLTIGSTTDSKWIVVSCGMYQGQSFFDAWVFSVYYAQWIQLDTGRNVPSPEQNPLLLAASSSLIIVGFNAVSSFSAALGTWNSQGTPAQGYFASPVNLEYESGISTYRTTTLMMNDRGAASPIGILLQLPECTASEAVPGPNLSSCVECPVETVLRNQLCVGCGFAELQPTASYNDKLRCWPLFQPLSLAGFIIFIIAMFVFPLTTRFGMWYIKSVATTKRHQLVALEVTEAVASLTLDRVRLLDNLMNPSPVEVAMSCSVANLKRFRRALPAAVLKVVDACARRSDDCSGRSEMSRDSTEARTVNSTVQQKAETSNNRGLSWWTAARQRHRSDWLVDVLLEELQYSMRLCTGAVTVFTVSDITKWADVQRASELAHRVAKIIGIILAEVAKTNGVPESVVGDRVFASWDTSVQLTNTDCLISATSCAHAVIRNSWLDRMSINVHAGIGYGNLRCGFIGCQADDAPPYRRFTEFGPTLTDAVNLSHAAQHLRLGVLVNWSCEERLRQFFVVKFAALLKFSNTTYQLYAGEVVCSQEERASLWDMLRLSEAASKFNHFVALGKRKERATDAAMLRDELPAEWFSALQHSLATGKIPQEAVPRSW